MFSKRTASQNRQPKKIGNILSDFIQNEDVKQKSDSVDFFKYWEQIVGPEFSGVSKPLRLNKGVLTIETVDAAYVQELSMRQKEIKKNIAILGFGGTVSKIKFISGNPKSLKK